MYACSISYTNYLQDLYIHVHIYIYDYMLSYYTNSYLDIDLYGSLAESPYATSKFTSSSERCSLIGSGTSLEMLELVLPPPGESEPGESLDSREMLQVKL